MSDDDSDGNRIRGYVLILIGLLTAWSVADDSDGVGSGSKALVGIALSLLESVIGKIGMYILCAILVGLGVFAVRRSSRHD